MVKKIFILPVLLLLIGITSGCIDDSNTSIGTVVINIYVIDDTPDTFFNGNPPTDYGDTPLYLPIDGEPMSIPLYSWIQPEPDIWVWEYTKIRDIPLHPSYADDDTFMGEIAEDPDDYEGILALGYFNIWPHPDQYTLVNIPFATLLNPLPIDVLDVTVHHWYFNGTPLP